MYGVITRNVDELEWPEFDRAFYGVKGVGGRHTDPVENAVNMVSCFGDNATAGTEPDLIPVDDEGNKATRDHPYFDWSYICPLAENYREGLLSVIEICTELSDDVRLDDIGFPRTEFCHCERCETAFAESEFDEWYDWRANVITEFVADAVDLIPGKTYVTLYPDPYPGHLYKREGIDVEAISELVDEFVVPIYDIHYSTTYWLESIASGFKDLLDLPFHIELYAVDIDVENLVHATEVADAYADGVTFSYQASNARAAIRRMNAESREGETFTPE